VAERRRGQRCWSDRDDPPDSCQPAFRGASSCRSDRCQTTHQLAAAAAGLAGAAAAAAALLGAAAS
jgi:hypothetical protein